MHLEVLGSALDCARRGGDGRKGPAPTGPTSTARHPELHGVPVLVVEDDASSAKLLFVLLTDEGSDVRVARSAEEALAIMQAFRPHVVVLDLVLPRMSGLLLGQMLKADPSTRGIVVIAATSFDRPETEKLVMDAGCDAYVHKPIDTETFPGVVAHHLGASRGKGRA